MAVRPYIVVAGDDVEEDVGVLPAQSLEAGVATQRPVEEVAGDDQLTDVLLAQPGEYLLDRKSTRLNSSHYS